MANKAYDQYYLSGFNGSTGAYSFSSAGTRLSNTAGTSVVENAAGGNTTTLGTVTNDTFTLSKGTGSTYTYWGFVEYKHNSTTEEGFVGYKVVSGTTSYFLFAVHAASSTANNPTSGTSLFDQQKSVAGNGATEFNLSTGLEACFTAGTLIATPDGEVAVEALVPGDRVLTADGSALPVRWVGRSTVSRVFADPLRILPIRIRAGALADNVPSRDLLVSPGHAMLLDGVLVQAGALVNGSSIVQEADMPLVFTYYHVELDRHTVLLAEGAPAESFLDGIEDMNFRNAAERVPTEMAELDYPRIKAARQVPAALRDRLAARLTGDLAEAA